MATFKIRDLMVALRPSVPTPERPKPFDDCDLPGQSVCPQVAGAFDSDPCDGSCAGCSPDPTNCPDCTYVTCGACSQCTNTCPFLTFDCQHTACGVNTMACDQTRIPIGGLIAAMPAGQLAVLKNQLRLAMQQVSRREKVLATAAEQGAIVPQTVEQVDALEKRLSEALEELRARRAELRKAAEAKSTESEKKQAEKKEVDREVQGKRGGKEKK